MSIFSPLARSLRDVNTSAGRTRIARLVDNQFSQIAPGDFLANLVNAEVSITGATTLTSSDFAKLHVCSGTTSNYTVTLPAVLGNGGKFIGLRMSSALTQLVTIAGNATDIIDGQNTRVMWAKEVAILYCDGTAWTKIGGKTIPMVCSMALNTSADPSIANSTTTKILVDTIVDNSAGMGDTTNTRINIKRPGTYLMTGAVTWKNLSQDSVRIITQLQVTTATLCNSETFGKAVGYPAPFATKQKTGLSTSDYLELWCFQNSGVAQSVLGVSSPNVTFMAATEIPTW